MPDRFSPIDDEDMVAYKLRQPTPALQDYLQQAYQMMYGDRSERPVPGPVVGDEPDMVISEKEAEENIDQPVSSESIGRGYVVEGDEYDYEDRQMLADQLAGVGKAVEQENAPRVRLGVPEYMTPPQELGITGADEADMRQFLTEPARPIARTAPFEYMPSDSPTVAGVDFGEAQIEDPAEMAGRAEELRAELARIESMLGSHGKNVKRGQDEEESLQRKKDRAWLAEGKRLGVPRSRKEVKREGSEEGGKSRARPLKEM